MALRNHLPVLLFSIVLFCSACQKAPNRAEFEKQVADIAQGRPPGSIAILVQIGDKYCELMASGQYKVDSQGSFSTPAMVKARELDKDNLFKSADGVAIVDSTAKYAQEYLCPGTR
jgi:hypothetical protein